MTIALFTKEPRAFSLFQKITEISDSQLRNVMSSLTENLLMMYSQESGLDTGDEDFDDKENNEEEYDPFKMSVKSNQHLLQQMDKNEAKIRELNDMNEKKELKIMDLEKENGRLKEEFDKLNLNIKRLNLQNQDYKNRVSFKHSNY